MTRLHGAPGIASGKDTALNTAWGKRIRIRSLSCLIGLLLLPTALVQAGVPDCDKAMAPQRCASYRQAWLSCNDMTDGAARACIEQYTPALSCKRSRDARQCEALQAAQQACDGTEGAARRLCVRERMPAADCSHASNKARCEQRAAAEWQCAETAGQQGRECVRKALIPAPAAASRPAPRR